MNFRWERAKKARNYGPPPCGPPPFGRAPLFLGSSSHPSGPPPKTKLAKCGLAKFGLQKLAKFGQIRMAKCGQLTLAKCGQIRMAKSGLAKCGHGLVVASRVRREAVGLKCSESSLVLLFQCKTGSTTRSIRVTARCDLTTDELMAMCAVRGGAPFASSEGRT